MPPRNPFLTIVVTGVPGVGKTTVLRHVQEMLEKEGIKHVVLNFGDFMFVAAKEHGLVRSRDEIRHLPLRTQLKLQVDAARALIAEAQSKLGNEGVLIVDTHAAIKTSTGYWPGLPREVVEVLRPDSIVLVEAKPEEIIARQQRDKSRVRSDIGTSPEAVAELMQMCRVAAMASAVLTASSVYPVMNVEGDPTVAAREVVELIKKLK